MYLYMKVSNDKYEYPIAMATSPKRLAEITGDKPGSISSMIYHKIGSYRKVLIEDSEE